MKMLIRHWKKLSSPIYLQKSPIKNKYKVPLINKNLKKRRKKPIKKKTDGTTPICPPISMKILRKDIPGKIFNQILLIKFFLIFGISPRVKDYFFNSIRILRKKQPFFMNILKSLREETKDISVENI